MAGTIDAEAAQQLRVANVGIRAAVVTELNKTVAALDGDPDRMNAMLTVEVAQLVGKYGSAASTFAAQWYDEQRAALKVKGKFAAAPYLPDYLPRKVAGTIGRAAGFLYAPNGPDMASVTTALIAAVPKLVLATSRDTIAVNAHRDPKAHGWQRVTKGDTCDFCRMLADRGGVYKQRTAGFAAHHDCNCAAVPSWDPDAREVGVEQYLASARNKLPADWKPRSRSQRQDVAAGRVTLEELRTARQSSLDAMRRDRNARVQAFIEAAYQA